MKENISTLIYIFLSLFPIAIIIFLTNLFFKKRKIEDVKFNFISLFFAFAVKIVLFEVYQKRIPYFNALMYIVIFFNIIKLATKFFEETYIKDAKLQAPKFVWNIFVTLLYFVSLFSVLKIQMGIDLTTLLTTSAVISVVVGLALQDTLVNFIAGIILHIESPFNYNDWVLVNSIEGKVVEINWRTVKLLTFSGDFLVIPNSEIIKNSIINFNYPNPNHVHIMKIGVSYDVPPNKLKAVVIDILKNSKYILKAPSPVVRLMKYNDFSIDYDVRVWINDYSKKMELEDEFMTKLWYAFKRENIKIPYPIREVYNLSEKLEKGDEIEKSDYEILREIELFFDIDDDLLFKISEKAVNKIYGKEEILFVQGEEGDTFFIIKEGSVSVIVNEKEIKVLRKGNFFGEMSLFTGKKRNATIKVLEDSELLIINRNIFQDIIMKNEYLLEKISSIIAKREMENQNLILSNENKNDIQKIKKIHEIKKKSLMSKIKKFFES